MTETGGTQHLSVMPTEVLESMGAKPGDWIVDGTLGGGGHTRLLAEQVAPDGCVIGLDADPKALGRCQRLVDELPVRLVHANFRELPELARQHEWPLLDGILLDLGLSSDQLADDGRGFSFLTDGPLDLRFDVSRGESAEELLNRCGERDLADLIYRFGEERASRRIAREIVNRRRGNSEWTSRRLADLVAGCVPRSKKNPIHPATRTFQALRIAVNGELESLELALREYPDFLKPGGRLVIISFHSLEDRLVKQAFRDDERWQVVTRKPLIAGEREIRDNPRSRSAKLRVAVRADESDEKAVRVPEAPKRNQFR